MDDEGRGPWVTICSDGPENGVRLRPASLATKLEVERTGRVFAWDGTYDENGDARYRVVTRA